MILSISSAIYNESLAIINSISNNWLARYPGAEEFLISHIDGFQTFKIFFQNVTVFLVIELE